MSAEIHLTLQRLAAWKSDFSRDEKGATMVEYGLMISLIAIAAFAGAVYFGTSLQGLFERVRDEISAAIQ